MQSEITSIAEIQQLVIDNAANWQAYDWKQHGDVYLDVSGDLLLFNYTQAAQYEARWNFFERVSRGLIIHRSTGEVVARAFDKFFNWGERGLTSNAPIRTITEKMDGSLGILYRDNDGYKISTRGSFTSDQALWATEFLNRNHPLPNLPTAWTLLFEIVYPENRIVVDYAGRQALILLAIRNRLDGSYLDFSQVETVATQYGFATPRTFRFASLAEIVAAQKELDANHEGWVVEFGDGQRFKFKGERYSELHRLITGLSFKFALELVVSGTTEQARSMLPEEYLPLFDGWVAEINAKTQAIIAQAQAVFAQAPKSSRKEFALWVQANHKPLASYLFLLLDGRDILPLVYKLAFEER